MRGERSGGAGHRAASTAYAVITVIPPALIVIFLVGSLALSGGRVSEPMREKWDVVVPYPLFPMPTVVLVALAVASVFLAIATVVTARAGDAVSRSGLAGVTSAAMVSAFGFALLVPDGGIRVGDRVFGAQLIAAAIEAIALGILLLGSARSRALARRTERMTKV